MAAELLRIFESDITSIELIPAKGGCFEVIVNQQMIYSKLEIHRHAQPGEIAERIKKQRKEGNL